MECLFKKDIHDWSSWGHVFQSIEDFQDLIEGIFIKENLEGYDQISNLTPGSNAVFKVGSYVIKIFAPKESGADTDPDYDEEVNSIKRAVRKGINTPNVIAASYIEDKYVFKYIIMDHIDGQEAGRMLSKCSSDQKLAFVRKLKENLCKINTKPEGIANNELLRKRAIDNARWNQYPNMIKTQVSDMLTCCSLSQPVHVHGDLTADNVLIDKNGNLFIIDFADSTVAPMEYEYPPIIFDLFNFDVEMVHEFIKGMNYDAFVEKLFTGTLLHQFGACFVKIIYEKCTGRDVCELSDIHEIKSLIHSEFLRGF